MRPFSVKWDYECDGSIISVATTPNFSSIAAATVGKSVYLFSGDGKPIWDSPFNVNYEAWATAITTAGDLIAVGTAQKQPADGTVYVISRDKKQRWVKRLRKPVWSVDLSSDGELLVVSTWGGNQLHIFKRTGSGYEEIASPVIPGDSGLYGCKVTGNGQLCLVASYDSGLYLVQQDGTIIGHAAIDDGGYNISLAADGTLVQVGLRSGSFCNVMIGDDIRVTSSHKVSQRPIVGISSVSDGTLVACGSHDGSLYLCDSAGSLLWSYQTKGEIWSTRLSACGEYVAVGGGDHRLRVLKNACHQAALKEVQAVESIVNESMPSTSVSDIDNLIVLYSKYGLFEYGCSRIRSFMRNPDCSHVFRQSLKTFLERNMADGEPSDRLHLQLGRLYMEEQDYLAAVRAFQVAARCPETRAIAQRFAAEAFHELNYSTAASSAWRQSRDQHLDDNARHVLYMLARSYEDVGEWGKASKIYETLLSWDVDFRNSWERLESASGYAGYRGLAPKHMQKDYTGITVSILGQIPPKDVDAQLKRIVEARSREVVRDDPQQFAMTTVVNGLLADADYSRGIRRDFSKLDYSLQLFLRYEYGLPEDEMKKFLETVNAYYVFERTRQLHSPPVSLDIGSATGRYPGLLNRLGFEAYGVDISKEAVEYSTAKHKGASFPRFIQGDARQLDSILDRTLRVDCITCMMGTFEHIPRSDQAGLIETLYSRLNNGGGLVISLWDVECAHLSYLSIYDEVQKERIRANCQTQQEMREMYIGAGFTEIRTVPFSLLPQSMVYDLGIEKMEPQDIEIAAQADLATRSLYPGRHGEMFLAIGFKAEKA